MIPQVQSLTANSENKDLKELQKFSLEDLSETEKSVLTAIMVSGSDKEAIELSPIGERRFYQLKPRLLQIMEQVKDELRGKAWQVLTGAVIKASQTMVEGLNQPSYKYRFEASKEILDRILGKAVQRSETVEQKAITILGLNVSAEDLEALKTPLTKLETDNTDSAKALDV